MAKAIAGGGVAAPRVSAPRVSVGAAKGGPKSFSGGPERGGFGGVAGAKFSSRSLESFRNPASTRVISTGTEGQAGNKMRIDSLGKPINSPGPKSEFSKPGVQNTFGKSA